MFNKDKKFGGKKFGAKYGDKKFSALHDTTCAKCKQPCQVPFKPNGKKPVFCLNCFRADQTSDKPTHRFSDRKQVSDKPMYQAPVDKKHDHVGDELKAINQKLDAIIDALSE